MKKFICKISNLILGNITFQKIFELLYKMSLLGMNIGGGTDYETSGETSIIKRIAHNYVGGKEVVVFDVGANIGGYSTELSKLFSSNATIYSFEPSKKTFATLKRNVRKYPNINIYNFGFSDKKSKLILYSDKKVSGLASVYNRRLKHFGIKMNFKENIKTKTIDSFCIEKNITHINFLKIDVEGHELKVLEGAKKILQNKGIDYIQFEFGGCNIDSRTFLQDFFYLFGDNYQIYRVLKNGLYNLGKYKEQYERFVTTNYLAILNK
jgi:FkbM family methyltransferase